MREGGEVGKDGGKERGEGSRREMRKVGIGGGRREHKGRRGACKKICMVCHLGWGSGRISGGTSTYWTSWFNIRCQVIHITH